MGTEQLWHSPLHERHVAAGANMAPFGGWSMPLEYAGVVAEHTAVRERVGLFDVSHLGKALVTGPGAVDALNERLTNDLRKVGPGQAQYTLLCDERGGTVDDLIAYVRSDDEVFLVPNAANAAEVVRRLTAGMPAGVRVEDQHREHAVLAVQGPASDETLAALGLPVGHDYMGFVDAALDGVALTVCRTGYTGERGYELVCPADRAGVVWDAVLGAGEAYGIARCGLGARDTLRQEMGYPLHGNDLGPDISPVAGGAGWAVAWKKERFDGDAALREERRAPTRVLRGLRAVGRGIPRHGMDVVGADGEVMGRVTSGTFSPTLRTGIALALLPPDVPLGAEVGVVVRTRTERFEVVRPPFVVAGVRDA